MNDDRIHSNEIKNSFNSVKTSNHVSFFQNFILKEFLKAFSYLIDFNFFTWLN